MVCLPSRPPPHGAMLLRQGSRLAGRLNTDWFVVHVETKQETGHRIDAALQRYLMEDEQRARDLGAEVVRLRSEKPVQALLDFARGSRSPAHCRGPFAQSLVASCPGPIAGVPAGYPCGWV